MSETSDTLRALAKRGYLTAEDIPSIVAHADAWDAERASDAELMFQAGCTLALHDFDVPASKLFRRARARGHPDADEQLASSQGGLT